MPRLEELRAWKSARETARLAYRLTNQEGMKHHFALVDQIRRSAISIPSNIAEGYGLGTRAQFIKGARIALGSAYELHTQLCLIKDLGLSSSAEVDVVTDHCTSTVRLIIALLRSQGSTLEYN